MTYTSPSGCQLVPVFQTLINNEQQQAVDARTLHERLASKQEFANWIKGRIEKYGFSEGSDYLINLSNNGERGKPRADYHLTLDMAKELAMVENNEQGQKIRRYFIEVEKSYRNQTQLQALNIDALVDAFTSKAEGVLLTMVQSELLSQQWAATREHYCVGEIIIGYLKAEKEHRKRGLVTRVGRSLQGYCLTHGYQAKRCAITDKWLYPANMILVWLPEGKTILRNHIARLNGQQELDFKGGSNVRRLKPKKDS